MAVMSAEARAEYLKRYLDPPKDKKKKKKTVLSVKKEIPDESRPQRLKLANSHASSTQQIDDTDISPPRKRGERSDSDASPPRRDRRADSDASPPRRRDRNDSDTSPPRRRDRYDSDTSPPRKRGRGISASPPRRRGVSNVSPPRKSIKNEPTYSNDEPGDDEGQLAAPRKRVTLFKRGKRNGKEPEDLERKARELSKQKEWEEKYKNWSKGVQQAKEREAKLQELSEVAQEGFTRYADDEAMNAYLKEQIYDDIDPMAKYYRTKQEKIEMKTGVVYPKYKGHWPPNRFDIAPGYRWDGVDRSNGFEARIASAENRRKAENAMAYRSIVECED